ncbi:MAG: radical SAM protein [Desulfuromonadaceae bacterium]|nr:radical SAM protein [Desulfuromonadaceae bacterium]MDD5106249.1 radical SAM protein [Desulfuromonadaceae bacterium]
MKPVTIPFFISHQGCPHTCVFCDQRAISGDNGAIPTAVQINDRIALWRTTSGERPLEVAFFGGTFTALPHVVQAALLEPLQPFLKNGSLDSIRISTRPDCIDTERVAWLSEMGVRTIELGVQSLDDAVLAASGRGHTGADCLTAICCIKAGKLKVGAQLMPGLPGDTPATSLVSLERVIAGGVDFLRIYPTVVIKGTELARRYAAGEYTPLPLDRGVSLCALLLQCAMKAGIPVIRLGLQADHGLDDDHILAGCWHPALGQLVRSRLYADLVTRFVFPGQRATVRCNPTRYSDVVGVRRNNLLVQAGRGVRMQIISDTAVPEEQLSIQTECTCSSYSIVTDLHYSIDEV